MEIPIAKGAVLAEKIENVGFNNSERKFVYGSPEPEIVEWRVVGHNGDSVIEFFKHEDESEKMLRLRLGDFLNAAEKYEGRYLVLVSGRATGRYRKHLTGNEVKRLAFELKLQILSLEAMSALTHPSITSSVSDQYMKTV